MTSTWDDTVTQHRGRRRQSIIDATMALVAERGLSDVSMAEVAKSAGIGRATLYRYFPGVEEIVAERVLDTVRTHHASLETAIAEQDDPVEAIRASLQILLGYFASTVHRSESARVNPDQFSPEVGREVQAAFAQMHGLLTQLVVDAQAAGSLQPDVDADFTAQLLYHMLSAGRTAVVRGQLSADEAVERIMRQFLHGAGLHGAGLHGAGADGAGAADGSRRTSRR